MNKINIIVDDDMINIDGKSIRYSNIRGIYKNNINGSGCQLNTEIYQEEIHQVCDEISTLIYLLQDLLNKGE